MMEAQLITLLIMIGVPALVIWLLGELVTKKTKANSGAGCLGDIFVGFLMFLFLFGIYAWFTG